MRGRFVRLFIRLPWVLTNELERQRTSDETFNPLRPNNDESQTSHCNIKGVSLSEVMRIENTITQVQFY